MAGGNRWRVLGLLVVSLALSASGEEAAENAPAPAASPPREQVGKPPEETEKRPEVTTLTEVGGVLTPRGTLRVEPTLEFIHTSFNRFNVRGFELVQGTILFGTIEAFESDRDTLIQSLTLRYGITSRFEFDATVPGVYRNERFVNTIPAADATETGRLEIETRDFEEYGLGDVEAGVHYQVNSGAGGWPYLIGNLRAKSDTGTGPLEVRRDTFGIEKELATGSGYWSVNPSFTLIAPAGPAVLYGNLGYLWNLEPSVKEVVALSPFQRVTSFDPGDAITMNLGLGLAVTEDFAFNLGFDYNFIRPSETVIIAEDSSGAPTRARIRSSDLQAGSLLFGLGYRFSPRLATQVNLAVGATDDAPDFRVTLRVPISLPLFD